MLPFTSFIGTIPRDCEKIQAENKSIFSWKSSNLMTLQFNKQAYPIDFSVDINAVPVMDVVSDLDALVDFDVDHHRVPTPIDR
jgi:hypothetical protein